MSKPLNQHSAKILTPQPPPLEQFEAELNNILLDDNELEPPSNAQTLLVLGKHQTHMPQAKKIDDFNKDDLAKTKSFKNPEKLMVPGSNDQKSSSKYQHSNSSDNMKFKYQQTIQKLGSIFRPADSSLDDITEEYSGSQISKQVKSPSESLVQSSFLESISLDDSNDEVAIRMKQKLNTHLLEHQREIYDSINYENVNKFKDLGGEESVNLNFKIELSKGKSFHPIQIATVKGNVELVQAILKNPTRCLESVDEDTGVNSFWLAAYFGFNLILKELCKAGINTLNTNTLTGSNALHIATERKNTLIVQSLLNMNFPLDEKKHGGLTALVIACLDKESDMIARLLIRAGADVNVLTEDKSSALCEAIAQNNQELIEILLQQGALMYYESEALRDYSPFFKAIRTQNIQAVELFCDHGADLSMKTMEGNTPLLFSAHNGFDKVSMYLSLRVQNIDQEDAHGMTVFMIYVKQGDLSRCKQLLMRGANINHQNKLGKSALHIAIEMELSETVVSFLLRRGALPHMEDIKKKDCCDLVRDAFNLSGETKYAASNGPEFKVFWSGECQRNKSLRVVFDRLGIRETIKEQLKKKYNLELKKELGKHGLGPTPVMVRGQSLFSQKSLLQSQKSAIFDDKELIRNISISSANSNFPPSLVKNNSSNPPVTTQRSSSSSSIQTSVSNSSKSPVLIRRRSSDDLENIEMPPKGSPKKQDGQLRKLATILSDSKDEEASLRHMESAARGSLKDIPIVENVDEEEKGNIELREDDQIDSGQLSSNQYPIRSPLVDTPARQDREFIEPVRIEEQKREVPPPIPIERTSPTVDTRSTDVVQNHPVIIREETPVDQPAEQFPVGAPMIQPRSSQLTQFGNQISPANYESENEQLIQDNEMKQDDTPPAESQNLSLIDPGSQPEERKGEDDSTLNRYNTNQQTQNATSEFYNMSEGVGGTLSNGAQTRSPNQNMTSPRHGEYSNTRRVSDDQRITEQSSGQENLTIGDSTSGHPPAQFRNQQIDFSLAGRSGYSRPNILPAMVTNTSRPMIVPAESLARANQFARDRSRQQTRAGFEPPVVSAKEIKDLIQKELQSSVKQEIQKILNDQLKSIQPGLDSSLNSTPIRRPSPHVPVRPVPFQTPAPAQPSEEERSQQLTQMLGYRANPTIRSELSGKKLKSPNSTSINSLIAASLRGVKANPMLRKRAAGGTNPHSSVSKYETPSRDRPSRQNPPTMMEQLDQIERSLGISDYQQVPSSLEEMQKRRIIRPIKKSRGTLEASTGRQFSSINSNMPLSRHQRQKTEMDSIPDTGSLLLPSVKRKKVRF